MNTRPDMRCLRAVVESLRFDGDAQSLHSVSDDDWPALLDLTDRARLTLPLGIRCRNALPPEIRSRIDRNLANNAIRYERTVAACEEIRQSLENVGIPFVFLKGLTHYPFFWDEPRHRQQYDLDVYCAPQDLERLLQAVVRSGYEPVDRGRQKHIDHLPVMIRRTGWRWRGDYYDPDMPLNLELHFRLWDSGTEMFEVTGAREFWGRRTCRSTGGINIPALQLADTVRYAAWHLVRHLLRGDLTASHLYEFAHFLHCTAGDDIFWSAWSDRSSEDLLAETMAARLAVDCFGCKLNSSVQALLNGLPEPVSRWFDLFSFSPLAAYVIPNKDEFFLQMALARGIGKKLKIMARRVVPPLPARFIRDAHSGIDLSRAARLLDDFAFRMRRAGHHLRTLAPLARSGAQWFRSVPNPAYSHRRERSCSHVE